MTRALLLLALVACQTPGAKIVYVISDGDSQGCGSSNCADVSVPCDAVVSIRVLRPSNPAEPLVTICEPLPKNRNRDLCALSSIDLSERPIELPIETLEVQMLIWAHDDVVSDTNPGELDCAKNDVQFDAVAGFPIAQAPAPALGGHTYYHPGDEEIRVTLGCTDLPALAKCDPDNDVEFSVAAENFDNLGVLVTVAQGRLLTVDLGEPKLRGADTSHSLTVADLTRLNLVETELAAVWRATFEPEYIDKVCAQVLDDTAQVTATVRCTDENVPITSDAFSTLRGVVLPKPTLDQILAALSLSQFPAEGLVVGVVVNSLFNPMPNQVVTATNATVRYLSADRTNANGTSTSTNGIFISEDADFATSRFSVGGGVSEVGGLIQGKVNVVVVVAPN